MGYTPPPMKSVKIMATLVAKHYAETGKESVQWAQPHQLVTGEWLLGWAAGPMKPDTRIIVYARVVRVERSESGECDMKTLEEWYWDFPNSRYVDDVNFTHGDLDALSEATLPEDHPENLPEWQKGDDDADL